MATILIWMASFVIGGVGYNASKKQLSELGRILFSIMLTLSSWLLISYIAWVLGVELDIGTVSDGKMQEHWWLPIVALIMAVFSYFAFKKDEQ
ncbi:hypothetical protein [Reinekea sp. G2M2-21]|uniref:hypothetical protein n=1 Tax=Reinekea sp. G2M2-21 TaxID=2788942 RepID=UPI0018A88DF5|nr:hypothetical protein [Reinekea sp. G2M2-21]